ncbi:hypothetical protein LUZ61_008554 [Rhynchospora tenuis]|uniref:Protein kinase domain-containing protein n=1 Tax=Rhynchospora tenuis TaxID=198213 RepID=A0AAD5ZVR7_9POAL|nr:hypothetical protein LUZ61_008554 [Rhynchospora tenuis]
MRSARPQLRLELRKDEEIAVAPIWHSGTKSDGTAPQLSAARYFSFEELKRCSNNFSRDNLIGVGGFGQVYKGYCTNGVIVAIKRASKESIFFRKDFQSEIDVLSRVHHRNIVRFLGFCFEQGEQLLVYEYISEGTLFDTLPGKGGVHLDWTKRLQIALDSARGLAYLHELANPPIIHGHVKSSNILLDKNLNAKVISFVLSKLVFEKDKRHVYPQGRGIIAQVESEHVAGTFGYMAPEYKEAGLLSDKSDVYSYGMVMLEVITAKRPAGLANVVKEAIDENDQEYYGLRDIIDPTIVNQVRNVGLRKFVQLALKCLQDSASDRPSMSQIMREIDIILQNDETTTVIIK